MKAAKDFKTQLESRFDIKTQLLGGDKVVARACTPTTGKEEEIKNIPWEVGRIYTPCVVRGGVTHASCCFVGIGTDPAGCCRMVNGFCAERAPTQAAARRNMV